MTGNARRGAPIKPSQATTEPHITWVDGLRAWEEHAGRPRSSLAAEAGLDTSALTRLLNGLTDFGRCLKDSLRLLQACGAPEEVRTQWIVCYTRYEQEGWHEESSPRPPLPTDALPPPPAGPLVPWSEWRVRAAEHGTPLARATVACLSSPAVDRGVDKRIYRSVTRWLDEEAEHSRALSVDGRQGSGRTWALLRSVERLSELRQTPVFVLDPAEELDTAALEEFRAARREPYIVLVDTLDDEADARTVLGPLLAERRGRAPALYLLSGYEPPEWLERCEGVPVGRVTDEEVRQLSALLHSGRSRQRLSHNDRADLNRRLRSDKAPGIGEVVRLLTPGGDPRLTRYAADLHAQYRRFDGGDEGRQVQALGVLFLMYCGVRRLPVPDGVLSEAFTLSTGSLKHVHGHVTSRGERLVWLEHPRALDRALRRIARNNGEPTFEKLRRDALCRALGGVQPGNRLHRDFARRLVSRVSAADRAWLVRECRELVLGLALATARGSASMHIYAWYPLAQEALRADDGVAPDMQALLDRWKDGLSAEFVDTLTPQPRSPAEVMYMILALGRDETAVHMLRRLGSAAEWESGPWWDFFEMVEKAPGKRQLTEKLMPVLRGGGLDVPKLLRTANTAQVLPALVTEYGRPDERHWLWRHLHEILSDTAPATLQHRYRCARHFTALAGRCLSQRRHYLSLRVLGACLQPSLLDDPLCREFEREVDDIRRLESDAALGPRTVEALLPLVRTLPPSRAAEVWRRMLGFAVQWHPDLLPELSREALDAVGTLVDDGVPAKDYSHLHYAALETAIHARSLQPLDAAHYLAAFASVTEDQQVELLVRLASACLTATDRGMAEAAARYLTGCDIADPWKTTSAAQDYLDELADWAGAATPEPAADLSLRFGSMRPYALALRLLPGSRAKQQERARRLLESGPAPGLFRALVTELLRVGLAAEASELLSRRSDRSPDNECARAHAAALEGELGAARTHLRRLTATYHSTGHGAHPKAVRETARAMAERTSGNEARCYRMLARLQDLTPLTEGP